MRQWPDLGSTVVVEDGTQFLGSEAGVPLLRILGGQVGGDQREHQTSSYDCLWRFELYPLNKLRVFDEEKPRVRVYSMLAVAKGWNI